MAVRVNGDEITIHQVNDVLARAPALRQAPPAEAKREALRSLVDQQIGVQQAQARKLDTTPEVVKAIENARREILFRAFVASVAAAQPKPSADDVKKYFQDHPQLFASRKVYQLEMLDVPGGASTDKVRAIVAAGKTMTDIAAALKQAAVPFTADAGVRPAEQIPIAMLAGVADLKDGQIGAFPNGSHLWVVHVLASRPEPMNEDRATPLIQQFLFNQQGTAAFEQKMQELRKAASIEYKGEFAQADTTTPPSTQAPPSAPIEPARTTNKQLAPPVSGAVDSAAIDRGVSGLK